MAKMFSGVLLFESREKLYNFTISYMVIKELGLDRFRPGDTEKELKYENFTHAEMVKLGTLIQEYDCWIYPK